jgi:glycosyltransferase involved in cell wall biosynthesis
LFSIIIPVYNKKQYIIRALRSVFAQTFTAFEVIVINDGSTDGSGALVDSEFGDRIQLIHQDNLGVSLARNRGIQLAKYSCLAFLDADDYWHPDYLAFMARVIQENPSVGIIGCHYSSQALEQNPQLRYFRLERYFEIAIPNPLFFTSGTCLKKSFFEQRAGFDPKLKLGEDIDVWLRASLFFGDGLYIRNTLVYYSQEDEVAATKKKYPVESTLISKLLDSDYYQSAINQSDCNLSTFDVFRSKWIYFNIFWLFCFPDNASKLKPLLHQIPHKYGLIHPIYSLPFSFLSVVFNNRYLAKLFRNYMKFCFRFIYT